MLLGCVIDRGIASSTCDENGNAFSFEERLGHITTYTYNADGLRVREEHDGVETRFVYDGNNLLREADDTNLPEADYTYIPQAYAEAISQRRDGDSSFYLADGIKNVRKLTDDAGLVTDEYAFDAFGGARPSTGSTTNSQQYKGQLLGYRRDPHAGPDTDYSTHHRNYNPKTGRFRSEDPAADDLNLYRYVNNDPVNRQDPSGLEPYQFTEEEMQEGQPQRYAARLSTWIRKQGEASVPAIEADAAAYDRWQSTSFVWGLRIGVVQTGTSALAVVADPIGALWNVKTAIEQSADYGYHHSEGRTVDSMLLAGSHLTGMEKIYDAGDKRTLSGQILTTDEQTDLRMAGWSQALGVASLPAVPLSMSSLYRSGTVAAVAPRSTLNRATASNPFDDFNFQFTAEIPQNNFGNIRIDVSPRSIVTQKGALSPVPTASPVPVVAGVAPKSVVDPQLDNNLLSQLANFAHPNHAAAVAYAEANKAAGLSVNRAAYKEFLQNFSKDQFSGLRERYGIKLIREISLEELGSTALRLRKAFDGTGRAIGEGDAKVAASALLRGEKLATNDLQFFKRAKDLGLNVEYVGSGNAAANAAKYVPQPVTIP